MSNTSAEVEKTSTGRLYTRHKMYINSKSSMRVITAESMISTMVVALRPVSSLAGKIAISG